MSSLREIINFLKEVKIHSHRMLTLLCQSIGIDEYSSEGNDFVSELQWRWLCLCACSFVYGFNKTCCRNFKFKRKNEVRFMKITPLLLLPPPTIATSKGKNRKNNIIILIALRLNHNHHPFLLRCIECYRHGKNERLRTHSHSHSHFAIRALQQLENGNQ